jgi:hypothetical protein
MKGHLQHIAAVAAVILLAGGAIGQEAKLDTARIEQLTGLKGKMDEKEGVFKVSLPRTDIHVTTAGVKMTPPMGLTAWAAFINAGGHGHLGGTIAPHRVPAPGAGGRQGESTDLGGQLPAGIFPPPIRVHT